MSVLELSKLAKLSRTTINTLAKNTELPKTTRIETLMKIGKALNVRINDIAVPDSVNYSISKIYSVVSLDPSLIGVYKIKFITETTTKYFYSLILSTTILTDDAQKQYNEQHYALESETIRTISSIYQVTFNRKIDTLLTWLSNFPNEQADYSDKALALENKFYLQGNLRNIQIEILSADQFVKVINTATKGSGLKQERNTLAHNPQNIDTSTLGFPNIDGNEALKIVKLVYKAVTDKIEHSSKTVSLVLTAPIDSTMNQQIYNFRYFPEKESFSNQKYRYNIPSNNLETFTLPKNIL